MVDRKIFYVNGLILMKRKIRLSDDKNSNQYDYKVINDE